MTTISYTISKSGTTGDRGVAVKGETEFIIRELQNSWKLKSGSAVVKVEMVYSKKDFTTFDSLKEELKKQGYEIK
ncbi:MAG: hypothetical protein PHX51_02120 [Clostridia bacterium]|nr:hypothetical protein [Clostridia bacterium]